MNFPSSPVIGTIAMQPRHGLGLLPLEADDSSLQALLTSLVQGSAVSAAGDAPVRLVASGRFSRFAFGDTGEADLIRADLARLVEDLEAEYDRLAMA